MFAFAAQATLVPSSAGNGGSAQDGGNAGVTGERSRGINVDNRQFAIKLLACSILYRNDPFSHRNSMIAESPACCGMLRIVSKRCQLPDTNPRSCRAVKKGAPHPMGAGLEGGSAPGRTCAGSALLLGEEASERTSSLATMLATSRMECGENLDIPATPATLRETAD